MAEQSNPPSGKVAKPSAPSQQQGQQAPAQPQQQAGAPLIRDWASI